MRPFRSLGLVLGAMPLLAPVPVLAAQMVVIGDKRQYLTCLIVPNFEVLEEFAAGAGLALLMLLAPMMLTLWMEALSAFVANPLGDG